MQLISAEGMVELRKNMHIAVPLISKQLQNPEKVELWRMGVVKHY